MFLADAVEKTSLQDNRRIDLNYMLGLVFFLIVMSFLTAVFMALKEYYYDSDSLPVDTVSIRGNLNELEIAPDVWLCLRHEEDVLFSRTPCM